MHRRKRPRTLPSRFGIRRKTSLANTAYRLAWAVEDDEQRERKKKSSKDASATWQWKSMTENLQLAHQELSVIIDLINTVEANDAVTVAGMTRPKPLPNELLSDLAVSTATKLQCYMHLGKYFKQSAKALEQQIAREARFYGALIRLQQNWKVKRQRVAGAASSNEVFTIDLFDNSSYGSTAISRQSSFSSIHIEHDSAGITHGSVGKHEKSTGKDSMTDDEYVKETHFLLREVHQSIFNDQVFHMLNCEAFNQPVGVSVTGIWENYLQLSMGQGTSLFISLVPSSEGDDQAVDIANTQNVDSAIVSLDSSDDVKLGEGKPDIPKGKKKWDFPNRKDGSGLLGHFCPSLGHRIFSNRVLMELENVGPISSFNDASNLAFPEIILDNLYESSSVHSSCRVPILEIRLPELQGFCKITVRSEYISSLNKYDCNLVDLPVIILQQVASQVIGWLREEALMVGVKTNQDFLSVTFELEQRETVTLVADVDPEVTEGGISWWLVMEDGFAEDGKLQTEMCDDTFEYRKFLGHLNLGVLYSTLMDLVQGSSSLEFDFKAVAPSKKNANQDKHSNRRLHFQILRFREEARHLVGGRSDWGGVTARWFWDEIRVKRDKVKWQRLIHECPKAFRCLLWQSLMGLLRLTDCQEWGLLLILDAGCVAVGGRILGIIFSSNVLFSGRLGRQF
ncbi:RNA polymerase II transcription mediators isoform 3 [Hibiscus syriacus]|uniref:RNA polymerase II transcription mediators isoform 3 n=1 Tax=Hibiscus syriacus TaxID=106335 RepID=A0A6A3D821_HIBSY|nr:RNA polymerase II transcription mediators isoform 3 [Hibiscus syriacus]